MKITIPENISDITLGQYQRYHKLTEREDLDQYNYNKRLIDIFTEVSFHDVDKIELKDAEEIIEQINKAINQDSEFVNRFNIGKVEFGFIPNFDNMTSGEYYDLSSHGLDVDTLHKVMAVLFRPIKNEDSFGNYAIYDYNGTDEYANLMLQMPMNVVNGALIFFCNLASELQSNILKYTAQVQKKVQQHLTTLKNGVGMQHFMN